MLHGCITALVTPFNSYGHIDEDAFVALIERQLASGIDGLLILGSTGEGTSLSLEERKLCIQLAVSTIKHHVPLIVNTGTNQLRNTLLNIEEAKQLGADLCLCISPYYLKTSQKGIVSYFEAVHAQTTLPIILYNVPSRTALDMTLETVLQLSTLPNIIGIKEANCSVERYSWYSDTITEPFDIYIGDDDFVCDGYAHGASALISVASNIFPEIMVRLCQAADQKLPDLHHLYHRCQPLFSSLFVEPNPIPVKWALHQLSLISVDMRLPLIPLDEKYHEELSSAMRLLLQ